MNTTRKDILLRRQKGKSILPGWKLCIEQAINQNVSDDSFLDIEDTERLRAQFFEKLRDCDCQHRFAEKEGVVKVICELAARIAKYGDRRLLLFHSKDMLIGALQLNAEAVSQSLEAIWRAVDEDLCIATSDQHSGFCLEKNYYNESGEYIPEGVCELTAWGEFAVK